MHYIMFSQILCRGALTYCELIYRRDSQGKEYNKKHLYSRQHIFVGCGWHRPLLQLLPESETPSHKRRFHRNMNAKTHIAWHQKQCQGEKEDTAYRTYNVWYKKKQVEEGWLVGWWVYWELVRGV